MKFFYLLAILLSTKIIFAQTYIPFPNDSATWVVSKYCNSPCNYSTDNQPQQIVQHGDSIKNGILYHKLYSVFSGTNSPTFFCFYRESAKKIYCKYPLGTIFGTDTSEFILYNFNLNVGDTFTIKTPTTVGALANVPKMRLNSITTTSVTYTTGLHTAYTFTSASGYTPYGLNLFITWYQGIGANQGFLYNLAYRDWPILTPPSYPYSYNLNCFYRSNSFAYNPSCLVTSIKEQSKLESPEINIYPNPVNGYLTIKLNTESENKKQIELTNILGELIFKKEITNSETQINISNFSNGVYFLKVFDKEKLITSNKLIKQ